jgi:RNA polymerase sigma-70 factor (sigma-E family)
MMAVVGVDDAAGTSGATVAAADLSQLYATEYRPLVRLASLLVDDTGTAEEIVQDAFVRASVRRLRDPDKALPYIRSAVINGSRSWLRRKRVASRFRQERRPDAAAAETLAMESARHSRMVAALQMLPRRQRECLVLRYYGDFSEAEIASTLGISAGSVKTHCHRGLAALAPLVEEDR